MNRREFLKKTAIAAAVAAIPSAAGALERKSQLPDEQEPVGKEFLLKEGEVILFTGDSITDGFREKKYYRLSNHIRSMGDGYVQLTATRMNYQLPEKSLKVYNTGVNGDTIIKMLDRLQIDCIALKPTVVSILVGVNDFNVAFSATGKGDPERYEREYRELLTRIREALPGVRFIIGEPYALKGAREKIDQWYPEFESYPKIARRIADEFGAVFIPYQSIYDKAAAGAPARYYSTDGIHPSLAGVHLMSDAWLSYVNPR